MSAITVLKLPPCYIYPTAHPLFLPALFSWVNRTSTTYLVSISRLIPISCLLAVSNAGNRNAPSPSPKKAAVASRYLFRLTSLITTRMILFFRHSRKRMSVPILPFPSAYVKHATKDFSTFLNYNMALLKKR